MQSKQIKHVHIITLITWHNIPDKQFRPNTWHCRQKLHDQYCTVHEIPNKHLMISTWKFRQTSYDKHENSDKCLMTNMKIQTNVFWQTWKFRQTSYDKHENSDKRLMTNITFQTNILWQTHDNQTRRGARMFTLKEINR